MSTKTQILSLVLAFFSISQAHSEVIELRSQELYNSDLTDLGWGYGLIQLVTPPRVVTINTKKPTVFRYGSMTDKVDTLFLISSEIDHEIRLDNGLNLKVDTPDIDSVYAIDLYNTRSVIGEDLSIEAIAKTTATAFSLASIQTPINIQSLSLKAKATDSATALSVVDSTIDLSGQLRLEAQTDTDNNAALAIYAVNNSQVTLESDGSSQIIGDILSDTSSSVRLSLNRANDRWEGNANGNVHFTLAKGARWKPMKTNELTHFEWGLGGVLDVRDQKENVTIEAGTFNIATGSVLHIDVEKTEVNQHPSMPDLAFNGQISSIGPIDLYADGSLEGDARYTITFNGSSNIVLNPLSQTGETLLHTYQTTPVIGSSSTSTSEITYEVTTQRTLLGASTLTQNQLDWTSVATIAHEQMMDRTFLQQIERGWDRERRLWGNVSMSETELALQNRSRHQTLQSKSLLMGYDQTVDIPFLTDGSIGVAVAFADHDVDMANASAQMDHYGINASIAGITTDNYRVVVSGHYQKGSSTLKSLGLLSTFSSGQPFEFDIDTTSYGASAYIGYVNDWGNDLGVTFEPFMMASTYRVEFDDANNHGVRYQTETLDHSIVRVGFTLRYDPLDIPFYVSTRINWVHRFGQSTTVNGMTENMTDQFKTENLKESSGELALRAGWHNDKGLNIDVHAQVAKSEVVKPKFDLSITANYRF